MFMRSGRPPTLWWHLIVTDGPPVKRDALDHVGIERALRQEIGAADASCASSSNTSMKSRPMVLRLASGSVDAGERAEEQRRPRRHGRAGCCSGRGTGRRPPRPRSARIRPWSTKTQVSWSPIASWISTAATAESTPPDRPQITRPLPTWARIAAIASSRKARHRPVAGCRPAIVADEVGEQPARRRACARPRGGTCTP